MGEAMSHRAAVLVVTPPGECGVAFAERIGARTTRGVLIELAASAEHSLFLASPFVQLSKRTVSGILGLALGAATARGVRLEVVSTDSGISAAKSSMLGVVRCDAATFYRPSSSLSYSELGSHAKVFMADEKVAYVGSANLTEPGLGGHLEMGLLVTGELAAQMAAFWRQLISTGMLEAVRT